MFVSAFIHEVGGKLIVRNLPVGTRKVWLWNNPRFAFRPTSLYLRELVTTAPVSRVYYDKLAGPAMPLCRIATFAEKSSDFESVPSVLRGSTIRCYLLITADNTDLDAAAFTYIRTRFCELGVGVLAMLLSYV